MQLGWIKRREPKSEPALELAVLKKIVAVSDEYWLALYQPITDVVTQCISVFDANRAGLYSDYADQFIRLVRRSKGGVQDDPLLVHLHTYSLVLSFSALYVARLCADFEFHAISKDKKTIGDRSIFYPWLSLPAKSEHKIRKAERIFPVYVTGVSVMNRIITDVGWKWLHTAPSILKALLDAIYSNGESGVYAGLLAELRKAPVTKADKFAITPQRFQSDLSDTGQPNGGSIDDLISNLGGGDDDFSFDELLDRASQTNSAASGKKPNSVAEENTISSSDELDLSVFDNQTQDEAHSTSEPPNNIDLPTVEPDNPPPVNEEEIWHAKLSEQKAASEQPIPSADHALDEFQDFLSSLGGNDGEESEQVGSEVPTFESAMDDSAAELDTNHIVKSASIDTAHEVEQNMLYSSVSSLTSDLILWCTKKLVCEAPNTGVYGVKVDLKSYIAIDAEQGLLNYVRDDYDLDSETKISTVADEVMMDVNMSSVWLPNKEGGDRWVLKIGAETRSVILLPASSDVEIPLIDTAIYSLSGE